LESTRRFPGSEEADETGATRDHGHEHYDYWRYAGRSWQWYEPMLSRMHPVPPVLDLGAGLGLFLECCRHHGTPAVGLELSKEGVQAAAAKRLSIVRGDLGLPFPFRDDSFGSAFAHHVLEHVPLEKERLILKEVRRVLRPGGFIYVVSPNVHQPDARNDPDHINLFAPRELAAEARRAGYRHVDLGTNFWRQFWEPPLHLGKFGNLISGALWKMAPIDRFAGSASVIAWK